MAATSASLGVLDMEAMAWLYCAEKVLIMSSIIGLVWLVFVVGTDSGTEVVFEVDGVVFVLCLKPSEDGGKGFCF